MQESQAEAPGRISPLLVIIAAVFVTALITSNIIAVKLVFILGEVLPAAIILFPLSYIIGDVLTEVYGYSVARRVIWLGFLCNLMAVGAIWGGGLLPAVDPEVGSAYDLLLGYAPRILGASFVAYLVGEFTNAFVLSRMKLLTGGRWLWARTISSTLVGQGLDSAVFISLAFVGTVAGGVLAEIVLVQWLAKVAYEVLATPLTYAVVGYLKRVEGRDAYDRGVGFNPVSLTH